MRSKILKMLSLTAAAAIIAGMLGACSSSPADGETATEPSSSTASENTLVMGTNAAFPPFEFVTSSGIVGEFDGIDVAIADRIAKSMDKQLVIEDMEFEGLIAAVQMGKIDMAVAGMTADYERRQSVDFSDDYFVAAQTIIVAKDNTTVTKAEDLKNLKAIGVIQGYTGDTTVSQTLEIPEANIVRFGRGIDAVQDLKNGKLDAVVIDSATAKALAEKNDLKVVEDPEVFEAEHYAIAVKKGNSELLEKINAVLAEMKENGEIEALAEKYN